MSNSVAKIEFYKTYLLFEFPYEWLILNTLVNRLEYR